MKYMIIIGLILILSACSTPEIPNTGTITIPEGTHVIIRSTTTQIENGTETIVEIINQGNTTTLKVGG